MENNIYYILNYDELLDIKREIWYNICDGKLNYQVG